MGWRFCWTEGYIWQEVSAFTVLLGKLPGVFPAECVVNTDLLLRVWMCTHVSLPPPAPNNFCEWKSLSKQKYLRCTYKYCFFFLKYTFIFFLLLLCFVLNELTLPCLRFSIFHGSLFSSVSTSAWVNVAFSFFQPILFSFLEASLLVEKSQLSAGFENVR